MRIDRRRPRGRLAIMIAAIGMVLAPFGAHAFDPQPEPPLLRAQAEKLKASGKNMHCQTNVMAKRLLKFFDPQPEPPGGIFARCDTKVSIAFEKAELKCAASGATCPTGDFLFIKSQVDRLSSQIDAYLTQKIGATPRFVQNNDGTVTDTETGLQWEKKENLDGIEVVENPHDADNTYNWATNSEDDPGRNGSAFTRFLYQLNLGHSDSGNEIGTETYGCFAGHCDWRLPTIEELRTILLEDPNPGNNPGDPECSTTPCIDPAFGPTPIAEPPSYYWSATTGSIDGIVYWPAAYIVDFYSGWVNSTYKHAIHHVRAVRSGS